MIDSNGVLSPQETAWILIQHLVHDVEEGEICLVPENIYDVEYRIFNHDALLTAALKIAADGLGIPFSTYCGPNPFQDKEGPYDV